MTTEEMIAFVLPVDTNRVSYDWQDRKMISDKLQALLDKTVQQAARIAELELVNCNLEMGAKRLIRRLPDDDPVRLQVLDLVMRLNPDAFNPLRQDESSPHPAPKGKTVRVRCLVRLDSGKWIAFTNDDIASEWLGRAKGKGWKYCEWIDYGFDFVDEIPATVERAKGVSDAKAR